MSALTISVSEVFTPKGSVHYVAILPPGTLFQKGFTPETILGSLSAEWMPESPITASVFIPNQSFVALMHDVISRHAIHSPGFVAAAGRQKDGYVVLVDQRTPTPDGPVPPEDIIGVFAVALGLVVPGSYQASPRHQILSTRGFFRLPDDLEQCLIDEITSRPAQRPS